MTPAQTTERNVLSVLFCGRSTCSLVFSKIQNDEFFSHPAHRKLFNSLKFLFSQEIEIDYQSASQQLVKENDESLVVLCLELAEMQSLPSGAEFYCEELINLHSLRVASKILSGAAKQAADPGTSAIELIQTVERGLSLAKEGLYEKSGVIGIEPLLTHTFTQIEAYTESTSNGGITGINTGFRDLNDMTGGLQLTDLIILAARPSMGKTAYALNIIREACRRGTGVLFCSLEMGKVQIGIRLLAGEARVSAHLIRLGRLPKEDFNHLVKATGRLVEMKLFVDDKVNISVYDIADLARIYKERYGIQMLVIDYLQLVRKIVQQGRNNAEDVAEISRGLKLIAKEQNMAVIALSQLSRALEQRGGDKRPQLSDLRESGAIEQDADLVGFLYRPEVYFSDPAYEGKAELIIAKQRNGPTGTVVMKFDKKSMNFYDQTDFEPPPENLPF